MEKSLFAQLAQQLKNEKLAGRLYQKEGRAGFRDCVTVYRNQKIKFERYCYGEAAGLVCSFWGEGAADNTLVWQDGECLYSRKGEAPKALTDCEAGKLYFDGKAPAWQPVQDIKRSGEAGLGFFAMLGR